MDKAKLEARKKSFEDLIVSHKQGIIELRWCIDGIEKQIKAKGLNK